ncbi:hypothetical protein [Capnocytophaga bilenii]|jgi:hypothetical protein
METNTITFKEHLPLEKYQQLIVDEQISFSELGLEDLEKIYLSKEQSKLGMVTEHSEVQRRAIERKFNRE